MLATKIPSQSYDVDDPLWEGEQVRLTSVSDLGLALRNARQAQGFNQEELAENIGVSRAWISTLERGSSNPALRQVLDALDALGLSVHVMPRDSPPPQADLESLGRSHLDHAVRTPDADPPWKPGVWTADDAQRLIGDLLPAQKSLVHALSVGGGQLTSEQARQALGRPAGASFRGLTGSITKAVNRLQRGSLIAGDVRSPVEAMYEGHERAVRILLRPEAHDAFGVMSPTRVAPARTSPPSIDG